MILDGHVDDTNPVAVLDDDNPQHDDDEFSDSDDLHASHNIFTAAATPNNAMSIDPN